MHLLQTRKVIDYNGEETPLIPRFAGVHENSIRRLFWFAMYVLSRYVPDAYCARPWKSSQTVADRKVTDTLFLMFSYFPISSYSTELKKKPSTIIGLIPSWGKPDSSWQQK